MVAVGFRVIPTFRSGTRLFLKAEEIPEVLKCWEIMARLPSDPLQLPSRDDHLAGPEYRPAGDQAGDGRLPASYSLEMYRLWLSSKTAIALRLGEAFVSIGRPFARHRPARNTTRRCACSKGLRYRMTLFPNSRLRPFSSPEVSAIFRSAGGASHSSLAAPSKSSFEPLRRSVAWNDSTARG